MVQYQYDAPQGETDAGLVASSLSFRGVVHLAGAVTSLALVIGVGVWGYQMAMRDVSGVPVVRASEGPSRVQPADPGGTRALHQGLAVNAVVAEGEAARPADRLILAPEPLDLTLEDRVPVSAPREIAPEREQRRLTIKAAKPEDASPEAAEITPAPEVAGLPQTPRVEGGLGRSLRPKARPAALAPRASRPVAAEAASDIAPRDVDAETIPVGTRLAQLGAFGSKEIAEAEWAKLAQNFGEYLDGKDRVIQRAQSGGRTFYRLRAMGFDDLSDARRFCSALVAEKAECIPVVTR